MAELENTKELRASGIIRDLDAIIDEYEQQELDDSSLKNHDIPIKNQTENGENPDTETEWNSLLRKNVSLEQPLQKCANPENATRTPESVLISDAFSFLPKNDGTKESLDECDAAKISLNETKDVNLVNDDDILDCGNDCNGLDTEPVENCQISISNGDEKCGENPDETVGETPETEVTRICDDDLENSSNHGDIPVRIKSLTPDESRRAVSEAFQFIKGISDDEIDGDENSSKQESSIQNGDIRLEEQPELRDSRVISAAFDFLKSDDLEFATEDTTQSRLSTVIEHAEEEDEDDEEEDEDEKEEEEEDYDTEVEVERSSSNNSPILRKQSEVFREKSDSPDRSADNTSDDGCSSLDQTEDSDDDDEEVHVVPGAWRRSTFAYIGPEYDTSSEYSPSGSRSASPKIVEPSTPVRRTGSAASQRPSSIFPPSPAREKRGKMLSSQSLDSSTSSQDSQSKSMSVPHTAKENGLPPEVRILSATDSETSGDVFVDDTDLLNRSEESDVFDLVEKEIEVQQGKKSKKKNKHFLKASSRSESLSSVSTTASEREFRSKYRSLQRTKILRNASMVENGSCKTRPLSDVVDHFAALERPDDTQGFGFHIWGRRPVIVSTVEPGSIAEIAGLKTGDVFVSVNDINVIESSTEEVVQIIGRGTRKVTIGIGTGNLASEIPVCCGYLNKQCGSMLMKKWRKRWMELKADHCLYYYKTEGDVEPLGAVPVHNYMVTKAPDMNVDFAFKMTKYTSKTYLFTAESEEDMGRWANAINTAAQSRNKANTWIDISAHNVCLPALDIRKPDCHGNLYKMGNNNKAWRHRYCVLKDACLYYYTAQNSKMAKGVAHFHGYKVQGSMPYRKQFGFMLVPPDPEMRTFYFYAENETEHKRWMTAFQDSISNWVQVDNS